MADQRTINPAARLAGTLTMPGDKSISHRAAMLNAIADGEATIDNFLPGADCLATIAILRQLGVEIDFLNEEHTRLRVRGVGLYGLQEPTDVLDAANSGTTMRLMSGLLAGQSFFSVLTGDASLCRRPMARVIDPLVMMGARIMARGGGQFAPLAMRGARPLRAISYRLPVASAQVKSALLLAGLYAQGTTTLSGKVGSRDHTERMLHAMGGAVDIQPDSEGSEGAIGLAPGRQPRALSLTVPGDISTAAFWLVAGAAHPNAEITVRGVGMNPTRSGVIDVLEAMGADITMSNPTVQAGEPVADITVRSSRLQGVEIGGALIPRLIDELPVLAVAAAVAKGQTIIRDAEEMRAKESDRIATVAAGLAAMGVKVEPRRDGMIIEGGKLHGATIETAGDHRLTMSFAIAALLADRPTTIAAADSVAVSYPQFWQELDKIVMRDELSISKKPPAGVWGRGSTYTAFTIST